MKKHISAPENCTGCGLCANVCSKNAIRMVWSDTGFLIPQVDVDSCVNCGLCVKQCIALEESPAYTDNFDSVEAYGAWNKNSDIHKSSSSGGVFTALAEHTIRQGGVVFGVMWQDKLTAVFGKAEHPDELERMRGSKYTPAFPGTVYRDVKHELLNGREVLFCGTPCQVHALRKYLRRQYDNLLTVDIVCHGMPSHLILKKYIEHWEKVEGSPINHVSFREKPEGWLNYHLTRHFENKSTSSTEHHGDLFMKLFLSDLALNKVCYNCPYAHLPRQGDITLGDYWGVQHIHPDWPIPQGISAVLATTEKGRTALRDCSPALNLVPEAFETVYAKQKVVYIRPKKEIPPHRDRALRLLKKLPITSSVRHILDCVYRGRFCFVRKSIPWYFFRLAQKAKGLLRRFVRKS